MTDRHRHRPIARSAQLWGCALALALGLVAGARPAAAELAGGMRVASVEPSMITGNATEAPGVQIRAQIDLSEQTMTVYVDDQVVHVFKVSTGRKGHGTPTGQWNAAWLSPHHRSKKYNNAPMPWSVFFYGGYAVHGTTAISRLGRPASHGCVRLHPDNAKIFYSLVQKNGKENTLISIVR